MTDRKLDAEIAEKLFGLRRVVIGDDGAPRYSQDIAAAMSVVERMSDLNYDVAMWHRDGATFWEAQFLCNGMIGDEDAETLPLAICKAALSALTAIRDE